MENYPYRIYPAIRRGFVPTEWLQITKSVLWNFAIIPILPFLNNPKDLDPSYKMDLDLWDCLGRKKTLSYNQRNTINYLFYPFLSGALFEVYFVRETSHIFGFKQVTN